ncbi:hypothetical protein SmJEL517_g04373 [Synchytrium microbalum]|uniref:KANL3/Tex30 alpha/beta hydrolase-like domain-containing protein n=1 Tax=Synchytrium microbalum TaxID=1806994 RepID=A0A507BZK3_9FUNG|nr:uncharacterized protein SmJEL517_g04373 [Synchytrium microbalum]TPX32561.1 hypothetical protein SmJEL517_g04373 [Synchytrium microbalum]
METKSFTIPFPKSDIPCCIQTPPAPSTDTIGIILAHGAGGDLNSPAMASLATTLTKHNFTTLRFTASSLNLDHRVKQYEAVYTYTQSPSFATHVKTVPKQWILAGRSMGARASAALSALPSTDCVAVLAFSYPLHNERHTGGLRDALLKNLTRPILFVSGSNDNMCDLGILATTRTKMRQPNWLVTLEGGNHSGSVKGGGKANASVLECVGELCRSWVDYVVDGDEGSKWKDSECMLKAEKGGSVVRTWSKKVGTGSSSSKVGDAEQADESGKAADEDAEEDAEPPVKKRKAATSKKGKAAAADDDDTDVEVPPKATRKTARVTKKVKTVVEENDDDDEDEEPPK